mmetsp:Transcript_52906/g.127361  ORF Transcript_52906/g.127361 Transcript_52906/m.127361 type:complete len:215 (-) Transcript_52906:71-715(-)
MPAIRHTWTLSWLPQTCARTTMAFRAHATRKPSMGLSLEPSSRNGSRRLSKSLPTMRKPRSWRKSVPRPWTSTSSRGKLLPRFRTLHASRDTRCMRANLKRTTTRTSTWILSRRAPTCAPAITASPRPTSTRLSRLRGKLSQRLPQPLRSSRDLCALSYTRSCRARAKRRTSSTHTQTWPCHCSHSLSPWGARSRRSRPRMVTGTGPKRGTEST